MTMIWLVRIAAVALFTALGPVFASPGQAPPESFGVGLSIGLLVVGVSVLIGRLGARLQRRFPVGARRIGKGAYWFGTAIGVFCLVVAAFAVVSGAGGFAAVALGAGALYWLAGWGVRRAFTAA